LETAISKISLYGSTLTELSDQCIAKDDSITDWLQSIGNRVIHLFKHGVWIDEEFVMRTLTDHTIVVKTREEQGVLQRLFNKSIAQQYPSFGKAPEVDFLTGVVKSVQNFFHFVVEFIKHPKEVGALVPTTSRLARAVSNAVPEFDALDQTLGRRILNIGPGTGPEAEEIVKKLRIDDELVLVEYDAKFCDILQEKFGHLPNVKIIKASILDFDDQDGFDHVVTCLPLNAFTKELAIGALNQYAKLTKMGGTISYVQFMLFPLMQEFFNRYVYTMSDIVEIADARRTAFRTKWKRVQVDNVWLNFTPMRAYHFRRQEQLLSESA
jgi:phospholipid N-methyltransferase